jgi:hypothetical protein
MFFTQDPVEIVQSSNRDGFADTPQTSTLVVDIEPDFARSKIPADHSQQAHTCFEADGTSGFPAAASLNSWASNLKA